MDSDDRSLATQLSRKGGVRVWVANSYDKIPLTSSRQLLLLLM